MFVSCLFSVVTHHLNLAATFKRNSGQYTVHEVALADTFVWCHLQDINLNKFKGLTALYAECVRVAKRHVGIVKASPDADGTEPSFKLVLGAAITTTQVYVTLLTCIALGCCVLRRAAR